MHQNPLLNCVVLMQRSAKTYCSSGNSFCIRPSVKYGTTRVSYYQSRNWRGAEGPIAPLASYMQTLGPYLAYISDLVYFWLSMLLFFCVSRIILRWFSVLV